MHTCVHILMCTVPTYVKGTYNSICISPVTFWILSTPGDTGGLNEVGKETGNLN